MQNELMQYSKGSTPVPRQDRRVAREAKESFDEVRLRALQADGAMALAGHLMEGLIALDARAQSMAAGDPIKMAILMEIEATAILQCKNIQRGLYQSWGF